MIALVAVEPRGVAELAEGTAEMTVPPGTQPGQPASGRSREDAAWDAAQSIPKFLSQLSIEGGSYR